MITIIRFTNNILAKILPDHFPKIDREGTRRWYDHEKNLHRENGPAVIFKPGHHSIRKPSPGTKGTRYWFKHGKRHREDGPAREFENGLKEWWLDGEPHRLDGPAIVYSSDWGDWFINGRLLDKKTVLKWYRDNGFDPRRPLSQGESMLFKLTFMGVD